MLREVEDFLVGLIGKSPNTKRLYRYILSRFTKNVKKSLKQLTVRDVMIHLSDLEKGGASRNTLRVHIIVLKTWLKSAGRKDIADRIKSIKEAKTTPVALPKEDIIRMIGVAKNPRNRLIVQLLYNTGIRVSELTAIRVENIDFDDGMLRVKGKGNKTRLVLVDSKTLELLKDYLEGRTNGLIINLSTSYVRQIIKNLAKISGLENWREISPHKLRHAFAINWVKSGGDIEGLRRLLGHESLETSKVYLDFDFGHVKDIYRRIFEGEHKEVEKKRGVT